MSALDPFLVEGIGRIAGRAYGEQVRSHVRAHHDMVREHLHRSLPGLDLDRLSDTVRAHRAATVAALPTVAAEVDGVGEGAGIGTTAAWVLQMRAEVEFAVGVRHTPECSAVAVLPEASATGHTLAAQNVDLPPRYAPVLVVLRRRLDETTTFLTITPAGQLAHHGLNSHGVAVLANFVHTAGWRTGVPRYLLSRLALAEPTCAAAVRSVTAPPRAASRTLLVADPTTATCLELTPTQVGHAEPDAGYLAHTNHITGPLRGEDTAGAAWSRNSRARLARLRTLVDGRRLGITDLQEVLRDRKGVPDALCHRATDDPAIDYATVCSSVADTAARTLWVALGDPSAGTPYTPIDVEPAGPYDRRHERGTGMFRPHEFDAADPAVAAEHVRRFPFGVLVSGDGVDTGSRLRATHLPFLLGPTREDEAFPPTLLSHGSARNEQLLGLADGDEILVVLPGPDAYVSAAWYCDEADVPTWNYTAVHVSGRYRRLDRPGTERLLADTVTGFEAERGVAGWALERLDEGLVQGLARGVIAFEVVVDEVRSAAKLSQDKLPGDVDRVRAGLRERDGEHGVLAEMDRHGVTGRASAAAPSTGPTTATVPGPTTTTRPGGDA